MAEYIVRLNGFELITNFTLFGVDNYYLGDLYNSLLKHSMYQIERVDGKGPKEEKATRGRDVHA